MADKLGGMAKDLGLVSKGAIFRWRKVDFKKMRHRIDGMEICGYIVFDRLNAKVLLLFFRFFFRAMSNGDVRRLNQSIDTGKF